MNTMNAINLIRADHRKVDDLFDQIEQADDFKEKERLFQIVKQELLAHAYVEESIFYPLFAKDEEFSDFIENAYDEHQEVKDLLEELSVDMTSSIDPGDLEDRLEELMDCVEEHVQEEETELLPRIEKKMDAAELDQLGMRMQEAKGSAAKFAA